MIDIKELKKKSYKDVAEILEGGLKEFKETVDGINDVEGLNKLEESLMDEQKQYDEYIKTVEYTLPDAVEYDGERFTKNAIAKLVADFLNRSEVDWQFTLGYFQIVKTWRTKDLKTVDYNTFDSTLRMLNNLKFKGFSDWRNILAVNEYMKGCHEPYSIDTAYMIFLNQKHQAIMDRTTLVEKREPVNE